MAPASCTGAVLMFCQPSDASFIKLNAFAKRPVLRSGAVCHQTGADSPELRLCSSS